MGMEMTITIMEAGPQDTTINNPTRTVITRRSIQLPKRQDFMKVKISAY